eukprot:TRINITY_DN2278_c0_g1_i1.p1 TRINITY_DN2278_c0_g1~~TRINITY_DN2278_c0_g1_i1.p1  ORF type:complete len:463 (+),score=119.73 TRINITY_DN2278_c0_g1_i1:88-1476(+)
MAESLVKNVEQSLKQITEQYRNTHEQFQTPQSKHLYHALFEYRSIILNSDFSPTEISRHKKNLEKVFGLVNEVSVVFEQYETAVCCCFGKGLVIDSCERIEKELDALFIEMQLILPNTARIRDDSSIKPINFLTKSPSKANMIHAGHHLGYDLPIPENFRWPNSNPLDVIRLFKSGVLNLSNCYVTLDSLKDMVDIIESGQVTEIRLPWSVIPPCKFDSIVEFVNISMKPFPFSTWRIDLDYSRFDTTKFELFCLVLPQFQELTTFAFSHNHFGPTGLFFLSEALIRCPCLTELTLSYNDIGNNSLQYLAKLIQRQPNLEKIDFSHNILEPQGIEVLTDAIKGLIHLNEVKFSHNPLTSEGVRLLALALRNSDRLRILELSHVSLSSDGIVELANSLEKWKSLFSMDLSENEIVSSEAKELFRNVSTHPALSRLNLTENDIDEPTVDWMVQNRPRRMSMFQA